MRTDDYKLRQRKPLFIKDCSKLLLATLQCSQNPSHINSENVNSVRHENYSHFGRKVRKYLKYKINDKCKNNNIKDFYNETSSLWVSLVLNTKQKIYN
jgi:hypothetical protein